MASVVPALAVLQKLVAQKSLDHLGGGCASPQWRRGVVAEISRVFIGLGLP